MRRSFFLAAGIYLMILGVELHTVEDFEVAPTSDRALAAEQSIFGGSFYRPPVTVKVKDAWPWMALSGGAVIAIYAMVLGKGGGKAHG